MKAHFHSLTPAIPLLPELPVPIVAPHVHLLSLRDHAAVPLPACHVYYKVPAHLLHLLGGGGVLERVLGWGSGVVAKLAGVILAPGKDRACIRTL